MIIFLVLLLSSSAQAVEVKIENMLVKQELFNTIEFNMNTGVMSVSDMYKNIGVRLSLGKSTESANDLYVQDKFYTARLKSYIQTSAFYRWEINNKWSIEPFIAYTDYKTEWKVNGVDAKWGDDTDSDISYGAYLNYKYHNKYSMSVGYQYIYDKDKPEYGIETTTSISFGFSCAFD